MSISLFVYSLLINGNSKVGKVRVVERLGSKLNDQLSNKAPWNDSECGNKDCEPCSTQPGHCRKSNITYTVVCVNCALADNKVVYAGETHRAYLDRQQEHRQALATENMAYAPVRHHMEQHPHMEKIFSFRMMRQHKTSLERQIWEALLMETLEADTLMNSKGEWGQNHIPRASYDENNKPGNTKPLGGHLATSLNRNPVKWRSISHLATRE